MALAVRTEAIATGALLCFALTACGNATPHKTIGVSIQNSRSQFYSSLKDGMKWQADKDGYRLIMRDADTEAEQQSQIEYFIAQQVDAIIVVPVDSDMVGGAVLEANDYTIPVFATDIDSTSTDAKVAAYIASDNTQGGRQAARVMCDGVDGPGDVAILDQPEVSSVRDRVSGFRAAIHDECPNLRVVSDVDVGVEHNDAKKAVREITQAHKNLAGIFFVNDETLLAALPGLKSRPCTKPILVGYDAIDDIKPRIDKGVVYGDAEQYSRQLGITTITVVGASLGGKQFGVVKIDVGIYENHVCSERLSEK